MNLPWSTGLACRACPCQVFAFAFACCVCILFGACAPILARGEAASWVSAPREEFERPSWVEWGGERYLSRD